MASIYNYDDSTIVAGTDGNDYITNSGANVTINSGKGNDTISSDGSNVEINSNEGDNLVYNLHGYEDKHIDKMRLLLFLHLLS